MPGLSLSRRSLGSVTWSRTVAGTPGSSWSGTAGAGPADELRPVARQRTGAAQAVAARGARGARGVRAGGVAGTADGAGTAGTRDRPAVRRTGTGPCAVSGTRIEIVAVSGPAAVPGPITGPRAVTGPRSGTVANGTGTVRLSLGSATGPRRWPWVLRPVSGSRVPGLILLPRGAVSRTVSARRHGSARNASRRPRSPVPRDARTAAVSARVDPRAGRDNRTRDQHVVVAVLSWRRPPCKHSHRKSVSIIGACGSQAGKSCRLPPCRPNPPDTLKTQVRPAAARLTRPAPGERDPIDRAPAGTRGKPRPPRTGRSCPRSPPGIRPARSP